jgi:glycosyltransferase involved in cell wall biosynthesis
VEKNNPTKTISVVIPNYNDAHVLPISLNALLEQSYPPSEVIIIDDASTDNSIEVIQGFAQKYSVIKLMRNEANKGPVLSFLSGWECVTGDYVYFASADDYILPGFFEKSMALFEQYPEAGVCTGIGIFHKGEEVYEDPSPPYISNKPTYLSPQEVLNAYIKKKWYLLANSTLWRTEATRKVNGFPIELKTILDEFTLLMVTLNFGACFIPDTMTVYNIRADSFSSQHRKNPQVLQNDINISEKLMETTHSKWFPPSFVKYYKKKNKYKYGVALLTAFENAQNQCLHQIKETLPKNNFLDKLFLKMGYIFIKIQKILLRIYWYIMQGKSS